MPGGRRWFEAFLLLMCVGSGVKGLTGNASGQVVEHLFPHWGEYVWYSGLIVGGVLGLAGIAIWTVTGGLLERAAMYLLSGLCFGYTFSAVALCLVVDGISIYSTVLVFLFGILCQQRAWQVPRDLIERKVVEADRIELNAMRLAIQRFEPPQSGV